MKIISYPKKPLPESYKRFALAQIDAKNRGPFLSDGQVVDILDFESFSYSDQNPDFLVMFRASDPFFTKTLTEQKNGSGRKGYRFTVKTKMSLNLVLTDNTGKKIIYQNQYSLADEQLNNQPQSLSEKERQKDINNYNYTLDKTVSEDEIGDLFTVSNDKKTFRLTESFQKDILGIQLNRLLLLAKKDLHVLYDLRVKDRGQRYYTLKDIKEETLSEEILLNVQNNFKDISNISDFSQLDFSEEIAFNEKIINNYDENDKKQSKLVWASNFNQAILYSSKNDFEKARAHANKAVSFKIRGLVSKELLSYILSQKSGYNRIYNSDGTRKKIDLPQYIDIIGANNKSSTLVNTSLENNKSTSIEELKIDRENGYVLNEKGEKEYTGILYIEFVGNKTTRTLDLRSQITIEKPSDNYGKELLIEYEKKGKTKAKKIKAKENYSFYIEKTKEFYESFPVKKNAIEKLVSAGNPLAGGNDKFYLVKHDAGKVKIYEDKTFAFDGFILKLNKEDKGIKIDKNLDAPKFIKKASDFYEKCKDLKNKIKAGDYSNTLEDHIKMSDIYSKCVKK
jgi:hypothetical protein